MKGMSILTHDQPNAAMAPEKNMKKIPNSPTALPEPGKSRWNKFKSRCPVSKETFRKLSKAGKAPQPERMGIRCTFFDNAELNKWLADPINYRAGE
jgi:predicted DNA-binding transcriptional regulator AlpA